MEASMRARAALVLNLLAELGTALAVDKAKAEEDARQNELEALELQRLAQRVETLRREREPELASMLILAGSVAQDRTKDKRAAKLETAVEGLRLELKSAQEETDALRERVRDAQIATTRANLHAQQLSEEAARARGDAARAEKRAIREAQRANAAVEDKAATERRSSVLDRERAQLKSKMDALRPSLSATPRPRPSTAQQPQRSACESKHEREQEQFDFDV
jgi:predicted mannosyl-3-phosphoglycerate phosphatase (HAD superfamily)